MSWQRTVLFFIWRWYLLYICTVLFCNVNNWRRPRDGLVTCMGCTPPLAWWQLGQPPGLPTSLNRIKRGLENKWLYEENWKFKKETTTTTTKKTLAKLNYFGWKEYLKKIKAWFVRTPQNCFSPGVQSVPLSQTCSHEAAGSSSSIYMWLCVGYFRSILLQRVVYFEGIFVQFYMQLFSVLLHMCESVIVSFIVEEKKSQSLLVRPKLSVDELC